MNKIITFTICLLLASYIETNGQNEKVKFWANGRGMQQNTKLGGYTDSVNVAKNSSGYVLADLGININPIKNTELQAIIRMRSDLGGFYGGGNTIVLRRLNLKGLIANRVGYEVGDIYLKLSPYTTFNQNAEGSINEASVFSNLRKDIVYYDNFYLNNNSWWQQGGHAYFSTGFKSGFIDKIKYDAFITRVRTGPTMRFNGGGRIEFLSKDKFSFALNYVNVFDDKRVAPTAPSMSDQVASAEIFYKANMGRIQLVPAAEGGFSLLQYNQPMTGISNPVPTNIAGLQSYQDFFVDGNLGVNVPDKRIKLKVGYRYVGTDFVSAGAQTKKINFASVPQVFPSVDNQPNIPRGLNYYDITRSTQAYNVTLSPQLMTYDPRLSNATPYGVATPNRQGFYAEIGWSDSLNTLNVTGRANLSSDIQSVVPNSTYKRSFQVYQLIADLKINQLIDWKKQVTLYGGAQYESTSRGGSSSVSLNTVTLDAGLDVETFKRLYVIGGVKLLSSKGNEYIRLVDIYNEYSAPQAVNCDLDQQLVGYGLKYSFNSNIYLSVQNQMLFYKGYDISYIPISPTINPVSNTPYLINNNDITYSFNQWFIFFSMKM